jgi:hypothetical protein
VTEDASARAVGMVASRSYLDFGSFELFSRDDLEDEEE